MKYIFVLFFALHFSNANAQNLQFSQVLTFGLTATANTVVGVVPENKVWKIEFAHVGSSSLEVNNYSIVSKTANGWNQFPIWLKAGDILSANGSTNLPPSYFISIIEFNIVP
jgi:hypothetical protein